MAVIKASKAGIDVLGTAGTIPNNLNYSSDYNTLKYHIQGSTTIQVSKTSAGTAETTGTVAHNLGYIPFFSGYVYDGSSYYMNPINGVTGFDYEIYADSTNLYLYGGKVFSGAGTVSITFFYKVYRNNLGL